METTIKDAITLLVGKIISDVDVKADDVLKFTQAALNLAHTAQVVSFIEAEKSAETEII